VNCVKLRENQNQELYVFILTREGEAFGETSSVTKLQDKTAGLPTLFAFVLV